MNRIIKDYRIKPERILLSISYGVRNVWWLYDVWDYWQGKYQPIEDET